MAVAFILTRASFHDDYFGSSGTGMAFILTRATTKTDFHVGFILTRAAIAPAGAELPLDVDLGPGRIVPPFKEMTVQAVVTGGTGVSVESWSWEIASSNSKAPVTARYASVNAESDTIIYKAPAAVLGTTVTLTATAHVPGRTDTVSAVSHTVTPHSWPWRINAQGKFYPVRRFPVESEEA